MHRSNEASSLLPAVLRSGADCAVSASGIAGPEIAARLLDAGYDALLVGTSLLRDADGWAAQMMATGRT